MYVTARVVNFTFSILDRCRLLNALCARACLFARPRPFLPEEILERYCKVDELMHVFVFFCGNDGGVVLGLSPVL